MKNVTLSDADLTAYSGEHLLYELQFLSYTANELSKMTKPAPMASVLIESFGLHLRNLIDFFYTTAGKERDSDVIAADFCSGWNEVIGATLETARVRANKELGHLTLQRKSGFDPTEPWDIACLFNEISAVAKTFVTRAHPTKLNPEVGKWLTSFHSLRGTTVAVIRVLWQRTPQPPWSLCRQRTSSGRPSLPDPLLSKLLLSAPFVPEFVLWSRSRVVRRGRFSVSL